MPIRSPRRVYKIEQIRRNLDDNPDGIDTAPDQTILGQSVFIYAKIKEGIGKYLGLTPLDYDAEDYRGVFEGNGTNAGSLFRRRLGGFKVASYKLVANTSFNIEEKYYAPGATSPTVAFKQFRTMSIGFPKGHSVWEVVNFLGTTGRIGDIRAVVPPAGAAVDLHKSS